MNKNKILPTKSRCGPTSIAFQFQELAEGHKQYPNFDNKFFYPKI